MLAYYELVPVLSFLIQKGSCRACKSKISMQYPIVELLTGILFVCIFFTYVSIPKIVFDFIIVSLLMVITIYDIHHGIIPNTLVYTFIGLSFATLFFDINTLSFVEPSLWALLAGPILALPIWLLWKISSGTWIGLGDAKLFLGVGWILGIPVGISAFMLSFWIGACVSLLLIALARFIRVRKLNLRVKELTIKAEVPFAPFIIFSFYIVYFFEFNLITLIAP